MNNDYIIAPTLTSVTNNSPVRYRYREGQQVRRGGMKGTIIARDKTFVTCEPEYVVLWGDGHQSRHFEWELSA